MNINDYIMPEDFDINNIEEKDITHYKGKTHWRQTKEEAIYEQAIGYKCKKCGKSTNSMSWAMCKSCREEEEIERHKKRTIVEWDGVSPIYSNHTDKWFHSYEALEEYCEEENTPIEKMLLVPTIKEEHRYFNIENFVDEYGVYDTIEGLEKYEEQINDILKKINDDYPAYTPDEENRLDFN